MVLRVLDEPKQNGLFRVNRPRRMSLCFAPIYPVLCGIPNSAKVESWNHANRYFTAPTTHNFSLISCLECYIFNYLVGRRGFEPLISALRGWTPEIN